MLQLSTLWSSIRPLTGSGTKAQKMFAYDGNKLIVVYVYKALDHHRYTQEDAFSFRH